MTLIGLGIDWLSGLESFKFGLKDIGVGFWCTEALDKILRIVESISRS